MEIEINNIVYGMIIKKIIFNQLIRMYRKIQFNISWIIMI